MPLIRSTFAAIVILMTATLARAETLAFPTLNFQIEKPEAWRLVSQSEEFEVAVGVDLGSDLINRRVQDVERTSRLAVMVRDEQNPRVNPGIFLDVHPGRVDDIRLGLSRLGQVLQQNVTNYEPLTDGQLTTLGPFEAGVIRYRYDAQVASGTLRVEETFWLVPLGDSYLSISGGVEALRDADAMRSIEQAAQSLQRITAD